MRLNSVRELKQLLPAHLHRTFAAKARPRAGIASTAVASSASARRGALGYFLGVAAKGKNDYRLAVRLQDRALQKSALVEEISSKARGEVDVRYVGAIRARTAWYRSKQRPLMIGTSTGCLLDGFIMAGTLGCFVRKGSSTALYMLSNNHALAHENRYQIDGKTVQSGTLDGGNPASDGAAKLSAFVKLNAKATNFVDCAIAKLNAGTSPDVS